MKTLLALISRSLSPERVSRFPVHLERTGDLRIDVESFLATEEGKQELAALEHAYGEAKGRVRATG